VNNWLCFWHLLFSPCPEAALTTHVDFFQAGALFLLLGLHKRALFKGPMYFIKLLLTKISTSRQAHNKPNKLA
jgi:hypothetical protein